MPLIKKKDTDFYFENGHIVLTKTYLQDNLSHFKKITGGRIASILGLNKYVTPFRVWLSIVNLYKEEMDVTLAHVGHTIEPKIRDFVSQQLNINFKSYDPFAIKWDVFKENKIFGGIPDGEPIDDNGNFLYDAGKPMLEIKTSSFDGLVYKKIDGTLVLQKDENGFPIIKEKMAKYKSWFDPKTNELKINDEYAYQLALYLFLRKTNYGIFAICFLNLDDYKNPEKFQINNHIIKLKEMYVDLEQFGIIIEKVKKWYENYVVKGISPALTKEDEIWIKTQLQK